MKLTFLGTRGYIEESNSKHKMRSSLLIEDGDVRILIDHGDTWKGKLDDIHPTHILLTHCHPDHCFGFDEPTNTPTYMRRIVWQTLRPSTKQLLENRIIIGTKPFKIGNLTLLAVPCIHSTRCPTNGFIIDDGKHRIAYFPDVLWIPDYQDKLKDVDVYIGDGSYLEDAPGRVRWDDGMSFGHALVEDQVKWCKKVGISKIYFTHFGKQAVEQPDKLRDYLKELSEKYDVDITEAVDGMTIDTKQLATYKGIYLVEPHARLIAEKKKTLIVSTKKAPDEYVGTELLLIEDKKAYGTIRITKVRGPYNADRIRTRLRERHRISDEEWQRWWPDAKEVYVYEFEIVKLFDEPVPIRIPQGVQKWIKRVTIDLPVRMSPITPKEVKEILKHPERIREWSDERLLDDHRICHLWAGANWKTLPRELTKDEVKRFHKLLVEEMQRRGIQHKTPLSKGLAIAAESDNIDANIARFGRAPWFYVDGKWHKNTHMTGVETAKWISEIANIVICKAVGDLSRKVLDDAGVRVLEFDGTVREALDSFRAGRLSERTDISEVAPQTIEQIVEEIEKPSPYAPVHHYEDEDNLVKVEDVLKAWEKPIVLKKGYITLVGGLACWGKTSGDIDILVADREWVTHIHQPILFRLGRALPNNLGERIQLHFTGTYGGSFTNHIPVYDLVLVPSTERRLIRMERPIIVLEEDVDDLEGFEDVIVVKRVGNRKASSEDLP